MTAPDHVATICRALARVGRWTDDGTTAQAIVDELHATGARIVHPDDDPLSEELNHTAGAIGQLRNDVSTLAEIMARYLASLDATGLWPDVRAAEKIRDRGCGRPLEDLTEPDVELIRQQIEGS